VNTFTERRQFGRSEFEAPALVSAAGRNHGARLVDVSLKGALVEHDDTWSAYLGQPCRVRIELLPGALIATDATVAHVEGRHIGLQCSRIDLDGIAHLRHEVDVNAGAPAAPDHQHAKPDDQR